MKTSNKILIAFALALILIPVLGMVIVSATQYKTRTSKENVAKSENKSIKLLMMPTEGYFKKELTTFNRVSIEDGKNLNLQLSIVNGDKYGMKIPNDYKDAISATVGQDGELQIRFNDKIDRSANNGYGVIIIIYCPKIDKIDVSKLGAFTVNAQLDSLFIKSTNTENINFGSLVTYHNIIGETHNNCWVKNLKLELYKTRFQSQNNSFNSLNIVASQNSEVTVEGDENQTDKFNINILNLNTMGKVDVKIQNIKIINSMANVSDSTKIEVPTYVLKQMFKK